MRVMSKNFTQNTRKVLDCFYYLPHLPNEPNAEASTCMAVQALVHREYIRMIAVTFASQSTFSETIYSAYILAEVSCSYHLP